LSYAPWNVTFSLIGRPRESGNIYEIETIELWKNEIETIELWKPMLGSFGVDRSYGRFPMQLSRNGVTPSESNQFPRQCSASDWNTPKRVPGL
jgi:hypothetical protein